MKQNKVFLILCVTLVLTLSIGFAGCVSSGGGNKSSGSDDKNGENDLTCTIQYTDDTGSHSLEVTKGMPYGLSAIPEKTGYTFGGLFDAKQGGTQYVDENGVSLSPYNDDGNLVLFARFNPKEYTFVLDYQGASVTGDRSFPVNYDSEIQEMPKNLILEHKTFIGWFTEKNCGGTQVADSQGLVPLTNGKHTFNDKNFNLSDTEGNVIKLYAGFETEKFNVVFNFGDNLPSEEKSVEYGTPLSKIILKTRKTEGSEKGFAVLTWSKTQDGSRIFNGEIVDSIVLYAKDWAPVIDFNMDGDIEVPPIVAKAGSSITLPVPEKQCAKFLNWETGNGEICEITTMPEQSIVLNAKWQAKLVFDENGGTEVDDISKPVGTEITLPKPEKQGFIFAGWYTADKEKFTAGSMPLNGVVLKAGWYEVKTDKIILKPQDDGAYDPCHDWYHPYKGLAGGHTFGPNAESRYTIDLSEKIPQDGADISIVMHTLIKGYNDYDIFQAGFYYYDDAEVSEANYLGKTVDRVTGNSYSDYTFRIDLKMRSNKLYVCFYAHNETNKSSEPYFKDIWVEITYPDIAKFYL